MKLSPEEQRVLGVMMEKQITTPSYYPITVNALVNGCNQKNSRWPLTGYTEPQVQRVLDVLRDRILSTIVHEHGARSPKYAQLLSRELRLEPPEVAIITVLLLRGPQTPGELRSRGEPLYSFRSLSEVEHTLEVLASRRPEPFVVLLPRQTGMREARYAHLLGDLEAQTAALESLSDGKGEGKSDGNAEVLALGNRVETLEAELKALRSKIEALEALWK
jgi:uncharacterized protein